MVPFLEMKVVVIFFVVCSVVIHARSKVVVTSLSFITRSTVGKIRKLLQVLEKRDFINRERAGHLPRTLHSGQHFVKLSLADLKAKRSKRYHEGKMSSNSTIWFPVRVDRKEITEEAGMTVDREVLKQP